MNKTIGFIGGGNMAAAMIERFIESKIIMPETILVCDNHDDKNDTAMIRTGNIKYPFTLPCDSLSLGMKELYISFSPSSILFLRTIPSNCS